MKWHHTSRLILIQIKFVAKTSLDYGSPVPFASSNPCRLFVLRFWLFQMMKAQRILSSAQLELLVILDYIAQRLFIVLLRMIFPWTEGYCLSIVFCLKIHKLFSVVESDQVHQLQCCMQVQYWVFPFYSIFYMFYTTPLHFRSNIVVFTPLHSVKSY